MPKTKVGQKYKEQYQKQHQVIKEKVAHAKDGNTGWHNKHIHVAYKQASEIGDYKGGKLYGYIAPEFNDIQWQNALSKGFAARAIGSNGVKLVEKKILEVKIKSDARLYTSEVHQNDRGDYLAIFDHCDDHKAIKKVIQAIKSTDELTIHADCNYNYDVSFGQCDFQECLIGDSAAYEGNV